MSAKVKCRICGKKIKKELAFSYKKGYYVCSEEEFELEEKFKKSKENIFNLFSIKPSVNIIKMLNTTIKRIVDENSKEFFIILSKEVCEIMNKGYIPNMNQNEKAKYIISVLLNHSEKLKNETYKLERDTFMEMYDYEYKKRPNRNDISKLLEVL